MYQGLDALFNDSPSCVTKKSRFLKMLMHKLFSVVPFGVAKKIRRTRKLMKFSKVVLSTGSQGKSAFFSLTS